MAFFGELRQEGKGFTVIDVGRCQIRTLCKWRLGSEVKSCRRVGEDDIAFGAGFASKDGANALGAFLGVGRS